TRCAPVSVCHGDLMDSGNARISVNARRPVTAAVSRQAECESGRESGSTPALPLSLRLTEASVNGATAAMIKASAASTVPQTGVSAAFVHHRAQRVATRTKARLR